MNLSYTPHILPFCVTALVLVALLAFALHNRRETVTPWLVASIAALLVWSLGYVMELASVTVQAKVFWADVQFLGVISLPVFWLAGMRHIVGASPLSRRVLCVLGAVAAALLVVMLVDPGGVFRGHPVIVHDGSLSLLDADYGIVYYAVGMPYAYLLFAWTVAMLARAAAHTHAHYRRRNLLLIVATGLPMAGGALYIAGVAPFRNYNPAMAATLVSALLCAWVLWRYRLFDIAPLARDAVIEHLADGVVVLDDEGRLVDFNGAAVRIFPELRRGALGEPAADVMACRSVIVEALARLRPDALQGPDDPAADEPLLVELDEQGDMLGGGKRRYSMALTSVANRGGRRLGVAIVLHDVTVRAEQLELMQRLVSTDELTGLLSRRRFFELAEQEVTRARRHGLPLSFLLLDIDGFKLINDVYGHAAGDQMLSAVAAACRRELRSFDLIGRYGGDELCVMLPHVERIDAECVGGRLRRIVAGVSLWHEGSLITATMSVGVSGVPRVTDETTQSLFAAADDALYCAKHEGRDRVRAASGEQAPVPETD